MKTIEAVLKISERCNIDCTYCYFFNKGDNSFSLHPALVTERVAAQIARFLLEAVKRDGVEKVMLDFHGGEPLLLKKKSFVQVCEAMRAILEPHVDLQFGLQTNAMLVDDEWIDILERFQFTVGVSLDGPKDFNDRARIDKKGRGTYDRTVSGLRLIRQARLDGRIPGFGILSVAAHDLSGREAFEHIVDTLGVSNMDFLLPIDPADAIERSHVNGYTSFLCDAFDAWVERNDPHITVRIFQTTMGSLTQGRASAMGISAAKAGDHKIVSIASNGDLGPDDTLRTLPTDLFDRFNVQTSSLDDFWQSETNQALQAAELTIPTECASCCWKFHCRGGAENGRIINRFRSDTGFNNASGMCKTLRAFYSHVAAYLLGAGLAYDDLVASVELNDLALSDYKEPCPFSRPASELCHPSSELATALS